MAEVPVTPVEVVDDPKKPWKAIGSFVLAFIGALAVATQGKEELDSNTDWVLVLGTAFLTALATYGIPNPKKAKVAGARHDERGQVNWVAIGAIAAVLILVVLFFTAVDFGGRD